MLTEKQRIHLARAVRRFRERYQQAEGSERQKNLLRARRCLSAFNFGFYGRDFFRDVRCWPILSVRQPWAELILRGLKVCENRTFRLPRACMHRPILLHASKRLDALPDALRQHIGPENVPGDDLPRGCIVGMVSFSSVGAEWRGQNAIQAILGPWALPDCFLWEIVAFWRFPIPIPARGALGFFHTPFDDSSILHDAHFLPPTSRGDGFADFGEWGGVN